MNNQLHNSFYTLVTNRSLLGCSINLFADTGSDNLCTDNRINKVSKIKNQVGVRVVLEGDVSPDEHGKLRSRRIEVCQGGVRYECDYTGTEVKIYPDKYTVSVEEEITPTPIFNRG